MNCTVCDFETAKVSLVKNGYNVLGCKRCGHKFTDLHLSSDEAEEIYSDDYFFGGKAGYPDYTLEMDLLIKRGEYYAKKIGKFINKGKVLDIGAAAGFILKGFQNMGWDGVGVEPNEKMCIYGRENLGIDLRQGTIETIQLDLKFDLIIMIQVIAHLFDLKRSITNAGHLLKPQGYLLVETWNSSSLTAKLFGKYWHEFSPPSTLNYFNKRTLDELMRKFNLCKVRSGCTAKKILSNHAKSLLISKAEDSRYSGIFSRIISLIPDNLILPYLSEDLFWVLYQKNV
jgi:2-polyprenyl-3-methyl-5-hydroxy-6-metoxy-1,4-benzoquinol methylase